MTDRELLEAAAKAAGLSIYFDDVGQCCKRQPRDPLSTWLWNPLTDDGDALRLAVKLRMTVRHDDVDACIAGWHGNQSAPTNDGMGPWFWKEWNYSDAAAATRRAIVCAAAMAAPERG